MHFLRGQMPPIGEVFRLRRELHFYQSSRVSLGNSAASGALKIRTETGVIEAPPVSGFYLGVRRKRVAELGF